MPKVKVNPNAKEPSFGAVQPGDYTMKFNRVKDHDKPLGEGQTNACKKSDKGNWYTKMVLTHEAPSNQLTSLETGQPLKPTESAGGVFVTFMMDPDMQGTLKQAFEAAGLEWPTDPNLDIDENWIQESLENRTVVARLKTSEYQGKWKNEVQRFITQS